MKTKTELHKIYDEIFNKNSIIEIEYALTDSTGNEEYNVLTFNSSALEANCSNIAEQVLCLYHTDKNAFDKDKFKLLQLMAYRPTLKRA